MLTPKRILSEARKEAERRVARCFTSREEDLDFEGLGITELPQSVRQIKWLRSLSAIRTQLSELPEWIGELTELTELHLNECPLESLPLGLFKLKSLRTLWLQGCSSRCATPLIATLPNLVSLCLQTANLQNFPAWLRKLSGLRQLLLDDNIIGTIPDWIGESKQLEWLTVSGTHLTALPSTLKKLKRLERLWVQSNLGLGIPIEIAESENAGKILDYYFRIEGLAQGQPLNEFKLILVGRGGVGKTSLVHRLISEKYKTFKRTPGIKITRWPLKIDDDDVQAHVWDFGGQEVMHGTHRFFMTERALYLVLISPRENTEDHDAEYWLSLVRSFAGDDAPVIVLLHKWDDAHFELTKGLLRDKYGHGLIFLETDSETGHGIEELRAHIRELARAMPGLKAKWPSDWRKVKEELPAAKKNWLAFGDFCTFCRERGVEELEDQEALAESLHALGLMLAYRKEEALRGFGVLNPQWVTKGIYDLLNSTALKAQNGKLTCGDFAKLLPSSKYPEKLHPYLLALMRKFRLCFPLDTDGRAYLIPELLTKEEPKLDAEFRPEQCLGFIYRYESVLPEGLLPRFIVETYVHREPKHAWRTGVVLERANCRALVRGDVLGRKVTIRVTGTGNGRRELLGIIREYFERIHKSFEKLPVIELVPVPEHPEVLIAYEELLAYERAGDDEYKAVVDEPSPSVTGLKRRSVTKLSVKQLLDGVDLPGAVRGLSKLLHAGEIVPRFSLFVSYARKDDLFRDELRGALTAYERKGEIDSWDDTRIEAGQKWEPEILNNLERADIIVLLLSNDFIRSDYCVQREWEIAKERDAAGKCAIVPIVVRDCRFDKLEVGQIQAIQPGGKPIKKHRDRDAAWLEVTKQLDRVFFRLKKHRAI